MSDNKAKAILDFNGVILEENKNINGKIGTVFFASLTCWNIARLYSALQYPAVISDSTFRYRVYGTGYAVFVPD